MRKFFYTRLALSGIRKNGKMYLPFLITFIGTVMMFYNMVYLTFAKDLGRLSESGSLRSLLMFAAYIVAIFSAILLFYTNIFLIKRRKMEFGLYNVLGMEKKHIAKLMTVETLMLSVLGIGVGLLAGILFSKLMLLLLFRVMTFTASFGFEVPLFAVVATILLFILITFLNLLYNIFQVYRTKPIELLKGGKMGEKEPRTKWLLTAIGLLTLGMGYYIALTTETPLAALNKFFLAVLLVMVGTYSLFTAGSIALLKLLRGNKRYYYKANHFIPISGMIYRMKQNAAGLANIAILSTAIIVTLSSTVSLYVGLEDALLTRYPRDVTISAPNVSDEEVLKMDEVIAREIAKAKLKEGNPFRHRTFEFVAIQNGDHFINGTETNFPLGDMAYIVLMPIREYNKLEGKSLSLQNGEAYLYSFRGKLEGERINLFGVPLTIKGRLPSITTDGQLSAMVTNSYFIIVDDLETIREISRSIKGKMGAVENLSYTYGFDVNGDRDAQIKLVRSLRSEIKQVVKNGYVEGREIQRQSFLTLYGGLFFIGVFLGLLFLMATVLIIYYKQITEGYDDRHRFAIMQKVGMSRAEVRRSIRTQVLMVFFLPLVTAVIHIAFAFKVITKLLYMFNLSNIPLFAVCTGVTILVFALFYIFVYALTAKSYYQIVSKNA